MRRAAVIAACALLLARAGAGADIEFRDCTGDCDGDGKVRIAELVLGVNIALGVAPLGECRSIACDPGGVTTVACVIDAVATAMRGDCVPVGGREQCGIVLCQPGEVCCNGLLSICTRPGGICIQ